MKHIKEGDLVELHYTDVWEFKAILLHTPQGEGDCYEFRIVNADAENSPHPFAKPGRLFAQNPYAKNYCGFCLIAKKGAF